MSGGGPAFSHPPDREPRAAGHAAARPARADLVNIEEPSNRAPLAWIHHRLQMWLWNINGGTAGLLVKVRRR